MSDPAEIRGRRLRWCDTHKQPAWDYADGSVQCMHDLIVESYNEHVLGPVLLADPAPVGLTEAEVLHMTDLREAWRRAAPVYTDLAATDVEWLCTLIDRLSSGVAEPPAEDREGVEYDRGLTARRILNWAGKHDADGKLVGVAVGTDERNVTVDAATMVRLLNKADDERRRADYYEDEMTEFLFRDPGGGA